MSCVSCASRGSHENGRPAASCEHSLADSVSLQHGAEGLGQPLLSNICVRASAGRMLPSGGGGSTPAPLLLLTHRLSVSSCARCCARSTSSSRSRSCSAATSASSPETFSCGQGKSEGRVGVLIVAPLKVRVGVLWVRVEVRVSNHIGDLSRTHNASGLWVTTAAASAPVGRLRHARDDGPCYQAMQFWLLHMRSPWTSRGARRPCTQLTVTQLRATMT